MSKRLALSKGDKARLSGLVLISLFLGFMGWALVYVYRQDRPATAEQLKAFVAESQCYREHSTDFLNRQIIKVRDLNKIRKDCEDLISEAKERSVQIDAIEEQRRAINVQEDPR